MLGGWGLRLVRERSARSEGLAFIVVTVKAAEAQPCVLLAVSNRAFGLRGQGQLDLISTENCRQLAGMRQGAGDFVDHDTIEPGGKMRMSCPQPFQRVISQNIDG